MRVYTVFEERTTLSTTLTWTPALTLSTYIYAPSGRRRGRRRGPGTVPGALTAHKKDVARSLFVQVSFTLTKVGQIIHQWFNRDLNCTQNY